jgi:hypothetical protein
MPVYLLAVHDIEGEPAPAPDVMQRLYDDVDALNHEFMAEGKWVFAAGLQPPETATVVSVKDGQTTTTDGPFAESKEHLGGFWVLKADDLDEALALAERASIACQAPVEVRPFESGLEESLSQPIQTTVPPPPAAES